MKKCLIILLLGLLSFIPTALAQEASPNIFMSHKPIQCGNQTEIFKDLKEKYGEVPFVLGKEPLLIPNRGLIEVPIMLFINPTKKTYTVVQMPPLQQEGVVCILSAGYLEYINEELELTLGGIKL
jgi:hypothetical protein